MPTVSPNIFKMYDIRGIYGQDLTDETAYQIGKGLGTFFQQNDQNKVIVGKDNRTSGESITSSLISGLTSTGCNVVNLGTVVTPLIYFSWYELDSNATVMVTASHNPPEYNGFKCSLNKKPLLSEDYQKIKEICTRENFITGSGQVTEFNIWPAYEKTILSSINLKKKLKVAIDCGNGTESLYAPQLIKKIGCDIVPLFCESDGSFPNHQPYPQKIEFYDALRKTIKEKKCDVGIAFDGDGDRIGFYDEEGNFIENDRLAMIFAKEICTHYPHSKIVMNISTSLSVIEYINSFGGKVILWKTGYPFISEKMKEEKAIFGGEISGHFFFRDKYYGYDDALYSALRMLEILSRQNVSFSKIIQELPKYYETREFRVEVPPNKDKFQIIEKIKSEIKNKILGAEILDIDGIRFSFKDGWGLIRASNTEPLLTGRAEAKSKEKLQQIKSVIKEELNKESITIDWNKYE